MGEKTGISWCDSTFNPWIGCSKCAVGCANCYAEADFDKRRHKAKWGPDGTRVVTSAGNWRNPLKWNREAERDGVRRKVFCASLCDVFEDISSDFVFHHTGSTIYRAFPDIKTPAGPADHFRVGLRDIRRDLATLIDGTPWLDWILLTKRPQNIRTMLWDMFGGDPHLNNVWLGYSASTQEDLDRGLPHLLACRDLAPVLFLSLEPLVGPIDLDAAWPGGMPCPGNGPYVAGVDWVIVGAESGPDARRCNAQWIRDIVRQCGSATVPAFVKQVGRNTAWSIHDGYGRWKEEIKHPKGGDPSEWPEDIRIRQIPTAFSP